METLIEFGRGPLFRFSFAVMILGIIRIFYLAFMARFDGSGPILPRQEAAISQAWLRPIYGGAVTLVHIGLISVPLFLIAHVRVWKDSLGFAWPPMEQIYADWLTIFVIGGLPFLTLLRILLPGPVSRRKPTEFLWPLLLVVPFITGYANSNLYLSARAYQVLSAMHLYSASLVLLLIPFTSMFYCVLEPITRLITGTTPNEMLERKESSK